MPKVRITIEVDDPYYGGAVDVNATEDEARVLARILKRIPPNGFDLCVLTASVIEPQHNPNEESGNRWDR